MSDDILNDPEFQEFADDVQRNLVPKLDSSAVVCSLVPEGPADIKYAIELGMSIMMDKPIIAVVRPGVKVPAKLVKVADAIIESAMETQADYENLSARVQQTVDELVGPDDDDDVEVVEL